MPLRAKSSDDPIRDTETWFVRNGLPYFVPAERAQVRHGLALKRTLPLLGFSVLAAIGVSLLLSWVTSDFELDVVKLLSFGPASLVTVAGLTLAFYGVTTLRARPILSYALRHSGASLATFMTLVTRALPLLLVFMTFLFVNAEVWQMSSELDGGALWLTVLLFAGLGVLFFLVRLPEEIDRADDELDDARVLEVVRGTPIEQEAVTVARRPGLLSEESKVEGYERLNLTLVLLITQTVQTILLSVSVFVFFVVFGSITMKQRVAEAWIGDAGPVHNLEWLPNLSVELVQVSLFLAAFAGLYFTVYAVTDEVYRVQFFSRVQRDLERAIAVRAAYVGWHRVNGREDDLDERQLAEQLEHPESSGPTTRLPSVDLDDQPTTRPTHD